MSGDFPNSAAYQQQRRNYDGGSPIKRAFGIPLTVLPTSQPAGVYIRRDRRTWVLDPTKGVFGVRRNYLRYVRF
jgi:hypothetical protein